MTAKKTPFALPTRPAQDVQQWVDGDPAPAATESPKPASTKAAGIKQARLTIDLPQPLHARFKAACAIHQTRMVDEVTRFIEDWTQKHR